MHAGAPAGLGGLARRATQGLRSRLGARGQFFLLASTAPFWDKGERHFPRLARKLSLTLRIIYDKYGNYGRHAIPGYPPSSPPINTSPVQTTYLTMKLKSVSLLAALAAATLGISHSQAAVVDLSNSLSATGSFNGALFFATDQQPAGTGFIDPFLRVQASPTEQGYNTDGGFPFDDKNPHNFQHSVQLSSLATFDVNGTQYFKFMLDANQSGGSNHTFTLTQLQVYTTNNPSQTTTTFNADGTLPLGTLAYNMNIGGSSDNSVITSATGSGKFDAIVYVPVSDFNLNDKYMVFYFAGKGNGGFEEWTAATGAAPVPELGTFFPVIGLLVAVLSTHALRRRQVLQVSRASKQ